MLLLSLAIRVIWLSLFSFAEARQEDALLVEKLVGLLFQFEIVGDILINYVPGTTLLYKWIKQIDLDN